ncbi:Hypothetical predicted protein, partial [Pelobates cultripes]
RSHLNVPPSMGASSHYSNTFFKGNQKQKPRSYANAVKNPYSVNRSPPISNDSKSNFRRNYFLTPRRHKGESYNPNLISLGKPPQSSTREEEESGATVNIAHDLGARPKHVYMNKRNVTTKPDFLEIAPSRATEEKTFPLFRNMHKKRGTPLEELEDEVDSPAKGLKYAPDRIPNIIDLFKDLNHFVRKLTVIRSFNIREATGREGCPKIFNTPQHKVIFYNLISLLEEQDIPQQNWDALDVVNANISSGLKPPSTYYPQVDKGLFIQMFYDLVLKDLKALCVELQKKKDRVCNNLDKLELLAVKSLKHNNNLIIKGVDKGGGGIVLLNKADYVNEAYNIIGNEEYYKALRCDPTQSIRNELKDLIELAYASGSIDKKEVSSFRPKRTYPFSITSRRCINL